MRIAVLTDIHGNREAFADVLADVAGAWRRPAGDIGRYRRLRWQIRSWCCDTAARLDARGGDLCIRGNHDNAAAGAR
jgi:hypothetical protein